MFARLSAMTVIERQSALTAVKSAIAKAGGWISGHSLFSNAAATVTFEIPAGRIEELAANLCAEGVNVSIETSLPSSEEDVIAILGITFISNELELRREVPALG